MVHKNEPFFIMNFNIFLFFVNNKFINILGGFLWIQIGIF